MKKFLLGTVGIAALGFVTQASAADLAARPYTKAPPLAVAAIYDWSGFYIGANGGYGTQRRNWDFYDAAGVFVANEGGHDADGGTAGGQIGYRWQSGQFVYGLEAQGNWADFRGSNASTVFANITNRSRMDAFGLFTGQIGYAWNNALLYAKGGAAVTSNRYDSINTATGALLGSARENSRWGATVGAGLEYGFTPNWSVGVEYNHIFVGSSDVTFTTPGGAFYANERIRGDADIVTARINYRWGGPVVARY